MPICKISNQLTALSFYDINDKPFYALANYSNDKVNIFDSLLNKTISWPTTEHFFQAQKIVDKRQREKFVRDMENKGPNECRTKVDNYKPHDLNWHRNETKQKVMLKALRAKYDQCPHVKTLINSSANMPIIEDTAGANYIDNTWGCGPKGEGENWLGILWMQVRAEKRDHKTENAARAEALSLQATVKPALMALGNRPGQLLQEHRNVTVLSLNQPQPTTAGNNSHHKTLVDIAKEFKKSMKPGENKSITATDGKKITYGISSKHGSFYIHGTGKHNKPYNVYVNNNNQIIENNKLMNPSKWANWAIQQIPPPIQNSNHQSPVVSMSPPMVSFRQAPVAPARSVRPPNAPANTFGVPLPGTTPVLASAITWGWWGLNQIARLAQAVFQFTPPDNGPTRRLR